MADDIQEVVAEAAEFVSEEADRFAEFARHLNKTKVQFSLLGVVCGTAAGAMATYALTYRNAAKRANERADVEIEEMQNHYRAKGMALEAEKGKGDLAQLVAEKGYTSDESNVVPLREGNASAPMAVQPPKTVLISEDNAAGDPPDDSAMSSDDVEGPTGLHEALAKEPETRNIFRERDKAITFDWDDHKERRQRNPDRPYVIHYDERNDMEGFSEVSLTYYSDDVLCDERDEIVDPAKRDDLVGEQNLDRFGHGSNDPDIVFVRNDHFEIVYEIVKSNNTYAEEVHGFRHYSSDRTNLERMRSRERDEDR